MFNLKEILNDDQHQLHTDVINSLIAIYYCLSNEFNKMEFIRAIDGTMELEKLLPKEDGKDGDSDIDEEQERAFRECINDEETWTIISDFYYYWSWHIDGIIKEIIPYNFASPIPIFKNKIEKRYKEYRDMDLGMIEKIIINQRYRFLQKPKVIIDLQKRYIQQTLSSDLTRTMCSYLTDFSQKDIKESLDLAINDENVLHETKDQLLYLYNHPKVKSKLIKILKREQELGFICYQEFVEYGKGILFKRLGDIVNVSQYFKTSKVYRRNEAFFNEFEAIGPYNIHLLFKSLHYTCLNEILVFYERARFYTFAAVSDTVKEAYLKQLDNVIEQNITPILNKIEDYYYKVSLKFHELFEKGAEVKRVLKQQKDQDLVRGVLSLVSPFAAVKNIYRIYSEETNAREAYKVTDKAIWQLYLKYIDSLTQTEKNLMQFYEKLYHEIYINVFLPFMKISFKVGEPVRKYGGLIKYEELIFSYISNMEEFYKILEKPTLNPFTEYIENIYFKKKILKQLK